MNPSSDLREGNNSTSSTSHSIIMDDFLATSNLFCGMVGISLNLLIGAFIVLTPQLHRTRNILWLGVAFSNVLVLFQHLVEFYVYVFQSEMAKKIFTLVTGLPFASLMLNLFFSLVDRYICIAYSDWYKRNVTIAWIVSGQIGCFFILCVLTKGPYFLEIIPLPAGLTPTDMKIVSIVGFTSLFVCTIGQVFVYFKLKYYLDLEKNTDTTLSSHRRAQHNYNAGQRPANNTEATEFMGVETHEERSFNERYHAAAESLQNPAASPHFIHIGDQNICRLELNAARHALDSVSSFFIFFLPFFTVLMFSFSADCTFANHLTRQECSTYLWTLAYTRLLIASYTVVNPIFFFVRNPDLSQALNLYCHDSSHTLYRGG